MPTLGSRKACGLISCSLPSAWVKYIGSTPALTSMTCSESSSFPAVSMRELNQPSPTSMFRPLKNTMSAVVVFSISAASGVYSCGSTPSDTMVCSSDLGPAIFAAISATTENVATIATPSSISASPPTAEVPHALTARAAPALMDKIFLTIDGGLFLFAPERAPQEPVAWGEEKSEREQHGAGQHDRGARGNVERGTKGHTHHAGECPEGRGEQGHGGQALGQEVRGRGGDYEHRDDQNDADGLQGGDGHEGQQRHQQVVQARGRQPVGGGTGRVEGAGLEFFEEQKYDREDGVAHPDRDPHVAGAYCEEISEQDLGEVGR